MTDDRSAMPITATTAELDAARAMADEVVSVLAGVRGFLRAQSAVMPLSQDGRDHSLPFIMMERAVHDAQEREATRVWQLLSRPSRDAETAEASHADA